MAGLAGPNFDGQALATEPPPTITCPENITQTADLGECQAAVTVPAPVISDNSEVESVLNDFNGTSDASGTYPVGVTSVEWTVTDIHGNSDACTMTVTVTDDEKPTITCPASITQTVDHGLCDAAVTVPAPMTSDNCGGASVVNDFNGTSDASGTYPVGVISVEWTVTDIHGNSDTCTMTVTVTDDEKPTITCPANITQTADLGLCDAAIMVPAPVTSDNCGVASVVNDFNGTSDASGTYPVGVTSVEWTVTDIHGNSDTCTVAVTVTDNEKPTITCPASITQTADLGLCDAAVTVPAPMTSDNCGVASVVNDFNGTANASGTYLVGATSVEWTVTDIHGNSDICTMTVTVTDDEEPTIICPSDIVVTNALGLCGSNVVFTISGSDNCGVLTATNQLAGLASGSLFPVGVTTNTFEVIDAACKRSECAFTVTVQDKEAPQMNCPADLVVANAFGLCGSNVVYAISGIDNCGALTTTNQLAGLASGSLFPVGVTTNSFEMFDEAGTPTTTDICSGTITGTTADSLTRTTQGISIVTWSFDDGHGQIVTAQQRIVVDDTIPPIIPMLADVTGQCAATIAGAPTTTDTCSGTITGMTDDPLTRITQGISLVTWTFNDGNGQVVTAQQRIVVDDTIAPNIPILADVTGQCAATIAGAPTTTDTCSGTITGTTADSLTRTTQGISLVVWSFDDGNGQIVTAQQRIVVDDTIPPIIPMLADVTGECAATILGVPATTDICSGTITGTTADSLTRTMQGISIVTWSFDDGHGQIVTAQQRIVVDDTIPPIIPILADVTGQCAATIVGAPTTTDTCSGPITGTTADSLTRTTQGISLVTWSFDDGHGQIVTAQQRIVVDDTIPPIIPILADVTGQCAATIAGAPTTTDTCSGTITGTTADSLTRTTQGISLVVWSFDDGNGQIVTAQQRIVVDDTIPPIIPMLADVTGQCAATILGVPATTDICSGTITGTTTDSLTRTMQGISLVVWSFDDGNGQIVTAQQRIVVDDTIPPIIPILADVTGQCAATILGVPATTDICSGAITGTTTDSLTRTMQGISIVTWSFDDGHGQIVTAQQRIVVDDTIPPIIPILADVTGQCAATILGVPATTDICSGAITGTTADPLTRNTQGISIVTWSFDDGHGQIVIAQQRIVVDDTIPPIIPMLADVTGQCAATIAGAPATTDTCSGTVTGTTADSLTRTTQGISLVVWSFDDGNSQVVTAQQRIVVDDTVPPIIPMLADVSGQCAATIASAPTTTDICSGTITATTADSLTRTTQGISIITWSFDDGNGQVVITQQRIVVDDTIPPIIPMLADVTGQCAATIASAPTTADICSGTITGTTGDPLTRTTQGISIVTWRFDDGHGQVVTVQQRIVVDDTVPPIIPMLADVSGQCAATIASAPTTMDICSGTITGTTADSLTRTTQGISLVTWRFDDGHGQTVTAQQRIVVDDTIPPITPILADVSGQCAATIASAPATTDACSGTVTGTTADSLTRTTQGISLVVWSFDDGNGQIVTAQQRIVVDDTIPPIIPILADVTGQCAATIASAPTTADICSGTITGTTGDPLTRTTQGISLVTWRFDDGHGQVVTVQQRIVVDDTIPPIIPMLADVTGQCAATIANAPATTDTCSGTVTGTTADSLTRTTQGISLVTWSFDDGNGQVVTAQQRILVDDTIPPIIPILADVTGQCAATIANAPATADICSGTITGTTGDPLTRTTQGISIVTWRFDDGHGQTVTAQQRIVVDDTIPPIIPMLADVSGQCAATIAGAPTTTDTCSGTLTGTTADSLTRITQGISLVTWRFDDGHGQTVTAQQRIVVDDTIPPITPILADVSGQCAATIANAPATTDTCSGTVTGTTADSLTRTTQGISIVTWSFDDGHGQVVTAQQRIVVDDTIAPIIPSLADVTGQCAATIADVPTTTDTCSGTITGTTADSLTRTTQGISLVTWSFDDGHGQVVTARQRIIVDDTIAPEVSMTITDAIVTEGNIGTGNAMLTVTLSSAAACQVTVDFVTADGTAKAPSDYTAARGTLAFAPGEMSKQIFVQVNGDRTEESDETFLVNLNNAHNAVIADSRATVRIVNDDVNSAPTVSIASPADYGNFFSPAIIPIDAIAGDEDGTIAKVEFFVNGRKVGESIEGPYRYNLRDLPEGDYTLLARATDDLGAVGSSTPVLIHVLPMVVVPRTKPTVSIDQVTVKEGDHGTSDASLTVKLSAVSEQLVTIDYATPGGTATSPSDYSPTAGKLIFAAGETTKIIPVKIIGDTLNEIDEAFAVNLSNASNATLLDPNGLVTIKNDDLIPDLGISGATITEGNSGTAQALFTVALFEASGQTVRVDYSTSHGTALPDTDYVAISGALTFAPGEKIKTITVLVKGDTLNEAEETFFVNLSGAGNAKIVNAQGIGTILNDDRLPDLLINDVTVNEGDAGTTDAILTVSLANESGQAVSVNYATGDGMALAQTDYTAENGRLTFAPETIRLIPERALTIESSDSATPKLNIVRIGDKLKISWFGPVDGFELRCKPSLFGTSHGHFICATCSLPVA